MKFYQKIREIIKLEDAEFVKEVYRELLEREADPIGLQHCVQHLRLGASKRDIIMGIMLTDEARTLYHLHKPSSSSRENAP